MWCTYGVIWCGVPTELHSVVYILSYPCGVPTELTSGVPTELRTVAYLLSYLL
jgi:hypothetical protein